jgi:hypothetical protein
MWTIGRSQRVEGKKYRPIVRKIRYLQILIYVTTTVKNDSRYHTSMWLSFFFLILSNPIGFQIKSDDNISGAQSYTRGLSDSI